MAGLLSTTGAQSRFGVAYVRALCAQAGYGFSETSPDEDVQAVDCTIKVPATDIRVQVKCTTKRFTKKNRYLSHTVEEHWREVWAQNVNDLYLVVVRLEPAAQGDWVTHSGDHTRQNAIGYWARIEPKNIPTSIRVYEANRLTHSTIAEWEQHLVAQYAA